MRSSRGPAQLQTIPQTGRAQPQRDGHHEGLAYKWIALSNTTLGVFMAFLNSSIVLIAMPAIFQGIGINPLEPAETNYLLWLLFGYMLVTATLLVTCGRISDLYGRTRLYNLGFAVFTLGSVLLTLTPGSGNSAALELIVFRLVQGVGASFLFANSTAILTDAFPPDERGLAMGINQVAGIFGSLAGLIVGGLLAAVQWRLVFVLSVPFGLFGTAWAYGKLRETVPVPQRPEIDWPGNITFAAGLTTFLLGITYGIQPSGGSPMGWTNPWVLGALVLGAALMGLFVWIEMRSASPMFRLELFRIRMFTMANVSNFLAALARGGLQFMLVIWLQGIWLPLHGYAFEEAPLWAAVDMTPMLAGYLLLGPLSGWLSDRLGSRLLATLGMFFTGAGFIGLSFLPPDFPFGWFAFVLVVLGIGQGLFVAPNTTALMNSLPPEHRGAGSGMRATLQNGAVVVSIGLFFSILIAALAQGLPPELYRRLTQEGLPQPEAEQIAHVPPTAALFAAFLGYNPMAALVPAAVLHHLPAATQAKLLSKQFFPGLIAAPFMVGLRIIFFLSAGMCCIAAIASWFRGQRVIFDSESGAE